MYRNRGGQFQFIHHCPHPMKYSVRKRVDTAQMGFGPSQFVPFLFGLAFYEFNQYDLMQAMGQNESK